MITNNYDANIVNIRRDTEGRILIIDLERHGTILTIGNMYATTRNFEREQQNAFNEITHNLNNMKNEHTIISEDFNLNMNPRLDKLDNIPEHPDNQLPRGYNPISRNKQPSGCLVNCQSGHEILHFAPNDLDLITVFALTACLTLSRTSAYCPVSNQTTAF